MDVGEKCSIFLINKDDLFSPEKNKKIKKKINLKGTSRCGCKQNRTGHTLVTVPAVRYTIVHCHAYEIFC